MLFQLFRGISTTPASVVNVSVQLGRSLAVALLSIYDRSACSSYPVCG